jgi:SAM-dependent methyltransferase
MAKEQDAGAHHPLVAETRAIWESKAEFWDARMGEGNPFQLILIGPAVERLLQVQPGERVLDIACGNGVFARRLARLGARVTATDFSPRFLELARARSAVSGEEIDYRLADATDEAQLVALGEGEFDAIVCTMALMDMPAIAPLFRAVRRLLRPSGRFVFAVPHPAFRSNAVSQLIEFEDRAGELVEGRSLRLRDYLHVPPGKGAGMPGEPAPHWYFHRPLAELLGACFGAGLVVDGLEEPAFGPEQADPERPLSWLNFTDFPPVLAIRARPAPTIPSPG